ncbi:MAG: hypothetical protein KIT84_36535 [Labilithrix sp.]|nr:hypothetical protein [Labilithrix sp.]MCW5816564.1 hypothetical protein [Labilithrix sp.]
MLIGLSRQAPWLWPLAVVGMVLWAYIIVRTPRRWMLVVGILASQLVSHGLWLQWSFEMTAVFFPGKTATAREIALAFIVLEALPTTALLVIAAAASFERRVPVCVWFPLAWALGEQLQWPLTNITVEWLGIFHTVEPMLRSVARFGLVPTLVMGLFILVGAGEAIGKWDRRIALPAAVLFVVLLVLPRPRERDRHVLEGMGAVHMKSDYAFPTVDEPDLDLVVWPEGSFSASPRIGEGPARDTRLDWPIGGAATTHLAGLLTHRGTHSFNSAVVVEPNGEITSARAKQVLFPITERRIFGIGQKAFKPGTNVPLLTAANRRLIPLVCFEFMARHLISQGRDAGGDVIVVLSSERYQAFSEASANQVRGILALRAAELRLPVVYASIEGHGWILSAEGQVLAEGNRYESGILSWSDAHGARDHRPAPRPTTAVVYARDTPQLRVDCPPGRCDYHALDEVRCDGTKRATVIVSGHSLPPTYLGATPDDLAAKVACFDPELVVLDTCFGASTPVLDALARRTKALVVASPDYVSGLGFHYAPEFFADGTPDARAEGVRRRAGLVTRWRPEPSELAALDEQALAFDRDGLRRRLRSWNPTLIALELPDQQQVLVPIDWHRAR